MLNDSTMVKFVITTFKSLYANIINLYNVLQITIYTSDNTPLFFQHATGLYTQPQECLCLFRAFHQGGYEM